MYFFYFIFFLGTNFSSSDTGSRSFPSWWYWLSQFLWTEAKFNALRENETKVSTDLLILDTMHRLCVIRTTSETRGKSERHCSHLKHVWNISQAGALKLKQQIITGTAFLSFANSSFDSRQFQNKARFIVAEATADQADNGFFFFLFFSSNCRN